MGIEVDTTLITSLPPFYNINYLGNYGHSCPRNCSESKSKYLHHITVDAPKSYVIIFAFLGNEPLAVYGYFLVLQLRVSTQINTVTRYALFTRFYSGYEGQRIQLLHLFVALLLLHHNTVQCNK